MPNPGVIIFLVLGVVAIAGTAAYAIRKRRREAIMKLAAMLGLTYESKAQSPAAGEFARFHLFSQGFAKKFLNAVAGVYSGANLTCFDYSFSVSDGKNTYARSQTVAAFRLLRESSPDFELRPENILLKIASVFGFQDIDFPENPEFSRSYLLRGKDENGVRAWFGPQTLAFFQQNKGWSVEAGGSWIVVYRSGKLARAENYQAFMESAKAVFAAFGRT